MQKTRCSWCGTTDQLYIDYHDHEWGVPVHDDRVLFEFLTLEGAQAGLSWITVLRKRENYRRLFHDWNIAKIANMSDADLEAILLDPGVVRNRLKVYSVRKNALVALELQKEFGSLDKYFWDPQRFRHSEERCATNGSHTPECEHPTKSGRHMNGVRIQDSGTLDPSYRQDDGHNVPVIHHGATIYDFPTESDISQKISKDLKKRGMSFVGSTIIYAFMQAVGMVDDHVDTCFRKTK